YRVRLVRYESGVDSKVSHACNDIFPIRFADIQMSLFCKKKNRRDRLMFKKIYKLAQNQLDNHPAHYGRNVRHVYHKRSAASSCNYILKYQTTVSKKAR